jgi:glutamate synthase (NADH)
MVSQLLLRFCDLLCVMQVTNPAIDPFRESCVTSLRTFIGPEGDVSAVVPEHAYRLELDQPVLTLTEMAAIKRMDFRGWHTNVIDTTYDSSMGSEGLNKTLLKICQASERAISWGYQILVRHAH